RALDGVTFEVGQGEVFALLGPNGAGKTTTVKILTTLSRPTSGGARVAGLDVIRDPGKVRQLIGVVAQRAGLDPTATGRENLVLQGRFFGIGGRKLKTRVEELLRMVDLTDAAGRLASTYSGGMARRLDIDPRRPVGARHARRRRRVGYRLPPFARRRLSPPHRPLVCVGRTHPPGGLTMTVALAHTGAIAVRHIRSFGRQPGWVAISLMQPVIYLLLFGQLFQSLGSNPAFGGS